MVSLLLAVIYLSFISLGLPDSLLGSAWPSVYPALGVPMSYSGFVFATISLCTVISSLMSDRLTRRFGASRITVVSIFMTAAALFGFSTVTSYPMMILWAIPYGLGAGSIDAALNNYVAIHFSSRHMSWLHCMWGVGTTVGPWIMSQTLTRGGNWTVGYRAISVIQCVIGLIVLLSLPLWKNAPVNSEAAGDGAETASSAEVSDSSSSSKRLTFAEILRIPCVKEVLLTFFAYCSLEQTVNLWASSYLVNHSGISAETAAGYASLFFIGITVGRGVSGFITMKLNDDRMVRLGQIILLLGVALVLIPAGITTALIGLVVIGLGCAPIYPSLIHATPSYFGADKSQAIIGLQMASAYVGTTLMPPVFGFIASALGVSLLPVWLVLLLAVMLVMHERMMKLGRR